jgi:hypothetical protein
MPLSGGGFGLLEAVEEIDSLLRMRGGAENRPLVVPESGQPRRNVGGVVVPHLRRQAKVGAQERAGGGSARPAPGRKDDAGPGRRGGQEVRLPGSGIADRSREARGHGVLPVAA